MTVATVLVALAALIVLVPSLTFFIQCLASVFATKRRSPVRERTATAAVLIPAHDEAEQIGTTVTRLRDQLQTGDRLIVVADNCSDDTATIAAQAGAEVIERFDTERRGKGYALHFGVQHLAHAPPDVVLVVDADCSLSGGSVDLLVADAARLDRPVQGDYVLTPPSLTGLGVVSALAMLVRNRVRPQGLHRLGLPCHLMGTGMAIPWKLMHEMPSLDAELTEDLVMGVELALQGHPPAFCPESIVSGELPTTQDAAKQQRVRWEHGHLSTLFRYGPRVLWKGLRTGRIGLVSTGLDLMIPPLALLVTAQVIVLAAGGMLAAIGGPRYPAMIAIAAMALVACAVLIGWARFGRGMIPFRSLAVAPIYLLWKAPIYLLYFTGRREREWRRTNRS